MVNRITTVKEFAEAVAQRVRACFGGDYSIEVKEVAKNNGVILTGLLAHNEQTNLAPVIYLDGFYRQYMDGKEMEAVCSQVICAFEEGMLEKPLEVSFIQDFDKVKDQVYCRLLNAERNQGMLEVTPHTRFHDLSVLAYIAVSAAGIGEGTIRVTDALMQTWGIDKDTLFAHAKKNTRRLGERVESIAQVLGEMLADGDLPEGLGGKAADPEKRGLFPQMYVASNDSRSFGAAVVLDESFLRDFSDRVGGSFYILPSSVHEVLFLPEAESVAADDLRAMVQEVNRTQVAPEEVLSDNVYFYNKETGRMEISSAASIQGGC